MTCPKEAAFVWGNTSVLLKLFINGNVKCHTICAPEYLDAPCKILPLTDRKYFLELCRTILVNYVTCHVCFEKSL